MFRVAFRHWAELRDDREEAVLVKLVQVPSSGVRGVHVVGVEAHAARSSACDTTMGFSLVVSPNSLAMILGIASSLQSGDAARVWLRRAPNEPIERAGRTPTESDWRWRLPRSLSIS